ncbi:Universal stress protein family protein [Halorubrum aquaticum]|uniref:Universal stress protein family protein n=1 Tax=Halorubrum aquaticum TaxID=387340 RepID=A0A1I3ATM7_9EURY|nr:universal stress protein [Halorubrum aquaticum]SFH53478.1 Universal stress protein family protein [Halorubrum aquaticum]
MTDTTPPDDPTRTETDRPAVLVPLEVLEGESPPTGTPDLLANAHVVLLGYHVIPEQTATEQAREQFGETAMAKLEGFAGTLAEAGATVEVRLVFTHDERTTIDRLIYEHDCLAVLVPNSTERVEEVLVAVRGTVGIDRNARLVAGLFAGTDVAVTLYHVLDDDETTDDGETLLNGVKAELVDRGMDPDGIEVVVEDAAAAVDAIARHGEAHDAVIMGETDPSVTTFVFGMPSEQVAERFLGPVLVVQRERPEGEAEE